MSKIAYDLTILRGIAFDVDGVLSPSTIPMGPDGAPARMVNIKDGYAMQLAVKCGINLAIITGADTPGIVTRYNALGITDIYLKSSHKVPILKQWMAERGLEASEVAFVGDDIPDLGAMSVAGLSVAPRDAAVEVRDVARYISPVDGGYGVARDLLEQVLKAQGLWMNDAKAFGW